MANPKPRIVIVGAGAMGLAFAERLCQVADVIVMARGATLDALRSGPARITGHDGTVAQPTLAVVDPDWRDPPDGWRDGGPADLLWLWTKAYDSKHAAAQAARHVDPAACLTLQNGLGNLEALAAAFGDPRVLGGTTTVGVTWEAPGRIRIAGQGDTLIGAPAAYAGPWPPRHLVDLLARCGIPAQTTPHLERSLWLKVCVNVGINPLTAIHRVPNGDLLDGAGLEAQLEAAVQEAAAVARAEGIPIDDEEALTRTRQVAQRTAGNRSSMLQSLDRGARTEIDALCGAVVERGRHHGVPTPVNRDLQQRVRALEARRTA